MHSQAHNERYENLAASIGSIMKPSTSTTIIIFNSSKGAIFLECFKLPVPLVVGRLWTITDMVVKVRINLSGKLESHQKGLNWNTPIMPRSSLVAQRLKRLPPMWETWVRSLGREDSPGEGNDNPLQYSCLENPMDRGAWWATVHGFPKSRTWLSDFTFYRLYIFRMF